MIQIAVLGYGTVGSGVVEVFFKNRENLQRKSDQELNLKYILDVRDFPGSPHSSLFTKNFENIADDDNVKIVVETIGGLEPAYTYTKACLERGKNVVTSNKELVAQHGAELLALARANHVNYLFEASVGGGIPIIRPLHMCLAANQINEIAGILNGTTNFILTKMFRENMSFDSALVLAQELGYAERDPRADIEGHDTCRKICILASLSFGEHVYPKDVYTQGITQITPEDVAYAADWGGAIKLIGRCKRNEKGEKLTVMVSPAFISKESQLGTVDDVYNGILVRGDATGDVVFYGKGAGKLPTASAVISDIIDCAKAIDTSPSLFWRPSDGGNVAPRKENETAMYLRCISGANLPGTARELFGFIQVLKRSDQPENESAFITPVLPEGKIDAAIKKLQIMGVVVCGKVRVLDY